MSKGKGFIFLLFSSSNCLVQIQLKWLQSTTLYPPALTSSGAGTPSPSLVHDLCPGPSHGGGRAPGCALGNNPRAGLDCGICVAGSFLWSGCGRVLGSVLFWRKWNACRLNILKVKPSFSLALFLPRYRAVALRLYAMETVLQGTDEDFAAVVCRNFGLLDQTDCRHQCLYSTAIISWRRERYALNMESGKWHIYQKLICWNLLLMQNLKREKKPTNFVWTIFLSSDNSIPVHCINKTFSFVLSANS